MRREPEARRVKAAVRAAPGEHVLCAGAGLGPAEEGGVPAGGYPQEGTRRRVPAAPCPHCSLSTAPAEPEHGGRPEAPGGQAGGGSLWAPQAPQE